MFPRRGRDLLRHPRTSCPGPAAVLAFTLAFGVAFASIRSSGQDPVSARGTESRHLQAVPRPPVDDADLRRWLESMVVHHRFQPDEITAATGLSGPEVQDALRRLALVDAAPPRRLPSDSLVVLPYPGGRHPRLGFFDGAIAPQRETKVSVFTPWTDGGYVVADVPEAIFSNLGLIYLAHTHIPTLWDQQGVTLPQLEWRREAQGILTIERGLPNRIRFGARIVPRPEGVSFRLWLQNGTTNGLSGLRVQNCMMLGAARGFTAQTLTNKVFSPPFAAARASDGPRWVITAWEHCGRAWGNEQVPCIHSDPVFPDCPPGQSRELNGWLSFFEGEDIQAEFRRLVRLGLPEDPPDPPRP